MRRPPDTDRTKQIIRDLRAAMPDPATIERMRQRLQALEPLQLELDDDSALHAGHVVISAAI